MKQKAAHLFLRLVYRKTKASAFECKSFGYKKTIVFGWSKMTNDNHFIKLMTFFLSYCFFFSMVTFVAQKPNEKKTIDHNQEKPWTYTCVCVCVWGLGHCLAFLLYLFWPRINLLAIWFVDLSIFMLCVCVCVWSFERKECLCECR